MAIFAGLFCVADRVQNADCPSTSGYPDLSSNGCSLGQAWVKANRVGKPLSQAS